jgi:KAP family P-loop domain/Trypsin-like peptidase domain/NB-ARC domain
VTENSGVAIPSYLGRVLDQSGEPVGTCFQIAAGIVATARHLVEGAAQTVGEEVKVDSLAKGLLEPTVATVISEDIPHDLALLRLSAPFPSQIPNFDASDRQSLDTPVVITGHASIQDVSIFRFIDAPGRWAGTTIRDDATALARIVSKDIVPGMSGAPVRRQSDGVVVGVVIARYNSGDGWLRDSVWLARTEDLLSLLADQSDALTEAAVAASVSLPSLMHPLVGRAQEVSELIASINSEGGPSSLCIYGAGGVGKTALAVTVARLAATRFKDGTVFLEAGKTGSDPSHLDNLVDGALAALRIDYQGEGVEVKRGRLASALRSRSALLILDDVRDSEILDLFLPPPRSPSFAIVTSRQAHQAVEARLALSPLSESDANRLLRKLLTSDATLSETTATALTEELSRLPLAITVAGGVLRRGGFSAEHLLEQLRQMSIPASNSDPAESSPIRSVFDLSYNQLSEQASRILNYLAQLDSPGPIPRHLIPFLLNEEATQAITKGVNELLSSGFLNEEQNGDFTMHDLVRVYSAARAVAVEPLDELAAVRDRAKRFLLLQLGYRHQPQPSIARDYWTTHDELSYGYYAEAIAQFIRHRQTRPPLTIGLRAPWGAGKTSLMRMIQESLDPQAQGRPARIQLTDRTRRRLGRHAPERSDEPQARVTNLEILRQARARSAGEGKAERDAPLSAELGEGSAWLQDHWRPTVWFNPWIYQSGEQIWAGMAFEIISQVSKRLPIGDRERFWLRLNLARIDSEAVRRRGLRLLAERLMPFMLAWGVAVLVAATTWALGWVLPTIQAVLSALAAAILGGTTVGALGAGFAQAWALLRRSATGSLGSLVRQPELLRTAGAQERLMSEQVKSGFDAALPDPAYSSRLGFLHLVQTDIRRVLDLVATPDRPLVVFVDDLDRCQSGAVAQVMEAINLFLAGEFPNCIFVLALEPSAVVAHLEVAYKDLSGIPGSSWAEEGSSSLGWRFLEKIVQLPVTLPPLRSDREIRQYLRSLVGIVDPAPVSLEATAERRDTALPPSSVNVQARPIVKEGSSSPTATPATFGEPNMVHVAAIAAAILRRQPTPSTLYEVTLQAQLEVLQQAGPLTSAAFAAADRIFSEMYSDMDAHSTLLEALPLMPSDNPREIKRFVNLFRFYSFIVERQRLLGYAAPTPSQVAKIAAFAIRWPHLASRIDGASDEHPLVYLENAAREDDLEAWTMAMRRVFAIPSGEIPAWGESLRLFLRAGAKMGPVATQLL